MFKFDPESRYMMPAHFGPRPTSSSSSGWYRDVTAISVRYLTDHQRLAAFLPERFEADDDAIISVTYACCRNVDWLAGHGYNMISVNAAARFKGANQTLTGSFTLVIWENLTDPILTGRELQGIPKIYADIQDHSVNNGRWHACANHFGHKILDLTVTDLRDPTAEEIQAYQTAGESAVNPMGWRYLPGIGGVGQSISEPTTFPSETIVDQIRVGRGQINWNHLTWQQNPTQFHIVNAIADLPVLELLPAEVVKCSINLVLPDRPTKLIE